MSDVLNSFLGKKKADSPFVTLKDGESVVIKKLVDIKLFQKPGFNGEVKDVLRLMVVVETSEGERQKTFDNGTQKFAEELSNKGIKPGLGFTLTRKGETTKTRYEISNVVKPEQE